MSLPRNAVSPEMVFALAILIGSLLLIFTQPAGSAAHTAAGSWLAAVLAPLLLPALLLEHAARIRTSAARMALSRKSLCIRSPPGSSGKREGSRPRRKVPRIIAAPHSRTQDIGEAKRASRAWYRWTQNLVPGRAMLSF